MSLFKKFLILGGLAVIAVTYLTDYLIDYQLYAYGIGILMFIFGILLKKSPEQLAREQAMRGAGYGGRFSPHGKPFRY